MMGGTRERKGSRRVRKGAGRDTQALLREFVRTRDVALRNELVAQHQALVQYLANKFAPRGIATTEDLVQVGTLGLIAAIERYDPTSGVSFVTFATPTIVGFIKHHLRDCTWALKIPRRLRELGMGLGRLREQLEQRLGRPPSAAEMAEAAGVSEERLLQAMEVSQLYHAASLDAPPRGEENPDAPSIADAMGDHDPGFKVFEEREAVEKALNCLADRERQVIYHRFFHEATQQEVAGVLGISQMHVSRLERRALERLKALLS
jgi:RNA polymerase sigma-B factor